MGQWIDLTGRQIGNWKLLQYVGQSKWLCQCLKCSCQYVRIGCKLRVGKSEQCLACCLEARTTHGHSKGGKTSATYNSWTSMIARCSRPACNDYHLYGGRGITVCARWMESFEFFLQDMGERPTGRQLDRIDPCGNYEPGNCRWLTSKENNQNRRNNLVVILNGQQMVITEAERKLGIRKGKLRYKMHELGWPKVDVATIHLTLGVKGTANPASKLTEDQVLDIRDADGTNLEISKRFGVSKSCIGAIRRRDTYSNIPDRHH